MNKILMLLLACTLVFSLVFAMTSCHLFNPDEPGNTDTPGDNTDDDGNDDGVDSDDTNFFDGSINVGSDGIYGPITDVNSTDMTQPPEGGETTEDGAEANPEE